jgi:hypothetical protein
MYCLYIIIVYVFIIVIKPVSNKLLPLLTNVNVLHNVFMRGQIDEGNSFIVFGIVPLKQQSQFIDLSPDDLLIRI